MARLETSDLGGETWQKGGQTDRHKEMLTAFEFAMKYFIISSGPEEKCRLKKNYNSLLYLGFIILSVLEKIPHVFIL
jgi:hypothetical protein